MNWKPPLGPRGGPVFPDFEFEARDNQLPPDFRRPGSPNSAASTAAMEAAPPGEPPNPYDVRCVYDSRPPNAFDFNVSILSGMPSGVGQAITVAFQVPPGYRWVPREWDITFEPIIAGPIENVIVSLQANGANLPYDQGLLLGGAGTSHPIKSFFLVDEQQTFGVLIQNNTAISSAVKIIVNVYGNSLPITDVSLPYEVTNKVRT